MDRKEIRTRLKIAFASFGIKDGLGEKPIIVGTSSQQKFSLAYSLLFILIIWSSWIPALCMNQHNCLSMETAQLLTILLSSSAGASGALGC
jgi:hypothetical protein